MRLITFILILLATRAAAQVEISGRVLNTKGETLPGVNVWIKDTFDGASTNAEGVFRFTTDPGDSLILVASAIGYHPQEVVLSGTEQMDVTLKTLVNELNAVSITAGTIDVSDKAASVVMKPLDILTTAGSLGDITGALATLPGTATVGNDGRLFVRGGDASEVGIFFDGLRVGNAYGTTAGNLPTRNRFSPHLFKGTFFSTGGYSAEFGDALSSVLSLETVDRPVRNQTDLSFMSVGASAASTFVGEKQSVTAEAGYINLGPYQDLVQQNFDWEKAPESLSTQVVYRHDLGKKGIIKGFVMGSKNEMAFWQKKIGSEDRGHLLDIENTFGFANTSYALPLQNWFLEGGVSLSLNRDRFDLDTALFKTQNDLIHLKQKGTYYFSESFKLKMGADVFLSEYKETDALRNFERGVEDIQTATWTEAEWFLSAKWTVRGGLRSVYFRENGDFRLEPRLAAAFQPYEHGTISFAAGRFSQAQESPNRIANGEISSSTADHYQISFQHANEKRTIRTEVYHKDYARLPVFFQGEIGAEGEGHARGFDVFYRERSLVKNTDFWLTYSFVESRRQLGTYRAEVQPRFAPTHHFSAVVKYWIGGLKSQVGATFAFNSGIPYDSPNRPGPMESTAPHFASLSLNWSYLYRKNLILHVSVNNVTGRDNIFGYRYGDAPDNRGWYEREPIRQSAPFFAFIGVFWTLSSDKSANQLNNL